MHLFIQKPQCKTTLRIYSWDGNFFEKEYLFSVKQKKEENSMYPWKSSAHAGNVRIFSTELQADRTLHLMLSGKEDAELTDFQAFQLQVVCF